jgi:hypothetical protein
MNFFSSSLRWSAIEACIATKENSRMSVRELLDVNYPFNVDVEAIPAWGFQRDKVSHSSWIRVARRGWFLM